MLIPLKTVENLMHDVVLELQDCFKESKFSSVGGYYPIQACRTRFIAYKVAALIHFIERFRAYLNHLMLLSGDKATKAADKQKLEGLFYAGEDAKYS